MNAEEFLRRFVYGEGYLALCYGSPSNVGNFKFVTEVPTSVPADIDVYFGPALRRIQDNHKEAVHGSIALWVDADDPQKTLATLPPSMTVFSGHGWHLYWLLKTPCTSVEEVERLNRLLAEDVPTADKACWNANRVLRVPGTTNCKNPDEPVKVELRATTGAVYTIEDVDVLKTLDRQTRHKIRTGDSRGYRSRSERDWAIVLALVMAGASDDLIELLFALQPCGDKVRGGPKDYLAHTIEQARQKREKEGNKTKGGSAAQAPLEIVEGDDGYYIPSRRGGLRRISTFTIDPSILLDGGRFEAEDAIVGTVKANSFDWPNITFSRSAFTTVPRLDRETPVAAWQWLGREDELRMLLPHLLGRLQEKGLPRVTASPVMGLHFTDGVPYFIGNNQVLGPNNVWKGYEGPMAWLPNKREHPDLNLTPGVSDDDLQTLRALIPILNDEGTIWPLIGWYAATPLKTWFEEQGHRFPILNVVGTKGSGKTTLIQRVFMPLLGQTDPKSYDAGTTRFVVLSLLGSTNGVPIAFSEFRYEAVEKFLRIVLLSYDTGHDPRGRGDQTTVDYALTAPFSVDGEDLIEDPAARERLVVSHLHPGAVEEGSDAYKAFQQLRRNMPAGFGGYYIQTLLKQLQQETLATLLQECREQVFSAFPGRLPDRVRSNHTVAYLGAVLWCKAVGMEPPSPEVMKSSITSVYDIETGRSRTLVDSMVEDIANECGRTTHLFKWNLEDDGRTLYFQLAGAHGWWISNRRRQGRGALERDAIRSQLRESPYLAPSKTIDGIYMFGIDLIKAQDFGLDVPARITARIFKVTI